MTVDSPPLPPGVPASPRRSPRALLRSAGRVIGDAASLWNDHDAGRIAAALAFYTLFSLAPILVIATAIAGAVWGREAVQGELVAELAQIVGRDGGRLLEQMIANAYVSSRTGWAAGVGVLVVLVGASAVFAELRLAFEQLWGRQPDGPPRFSRVVLALLAARLRGLAVVVGIGFVLLASLVLSSVLVAVGQPLRDALLQAGGLGLLVSWLPFVFSLAVTATMIGLLLRVLVPVRVPRARLIGSAVFGAVVFELAKAAVSLYLGHSAVTSVFGAAGSLAVLLVWLYAAAGVVLLSAVALRALTPPAAVLSAAVPSGAA